jgi:hypothetical protein
VITQTPKEFDFPGIPWPAQFHYAGPFHDDEGREPVLFPWDKLTDKPLIYASLGTLVNGLNDVYAHILETVKPLDVQVVLSVGKNICGGDLLLGQDSSGLTIHGLQPQRIFIAQGANRAGNIGPGLRPQAKFHG